MLKKMSEYEFLLKSIDENTLGACVSTLSNVGMLFILFKDDIQIVKVGILLISVEKILNTSRFNEKKLIKP